MTDRRAFLTAGLAVVPGLACRAEARPDGGGEEVGATEDLMREHGVLNRVLLVYEEGVRRLGAREDIPPEVFRAAATLVREFVEDYHERLEERFIFPAFERRNQHMDLVRVLRRQHEAGRRLTDVVLRAAAADRYATAAGKQELTAGVWSFVRMYRPHEAREDTVLFPALRGVLSAAEVKDLGERFEREEDRLFGEGGFQRTVERVARIERQLGTHDLDQFTPKTG